MSSILTSPRHHAPTDFSKPSTPATPPVFGFGLPGWRLDLPLCLFASFVRVWPPAIALAPPQLCLYPSNRIHSTRLASSSPCSRFLPISMFTYLDPSTVPYLFIFAAPLVPISFHVFSPSFVFVPPRSSFLPPVFQVIPLVLGFDSSSMFVTHQPRLFSPLSVGNRLHSSLFKLNISYHMLKDVAV
jgi:hypothetical protein